MQGEDIFRKEIAVVYFIRHMPVLFPDNFNGNEMEFIIQCAKGGLFSKTTCRGCNFHFNHSWIEGINLYILYIVPINSETPLLDTPLKKILYVLEE